MSRFVDTHGHLQTERFDNDREAVLAASLERLDWLTVVGDDLDSSRAAVALCQKNVYAVVGMHPYNASAVDDACLDVLHGLAQQPGVVALGEMGLDYFNEFSPRADQAVAFERQLQLAVKMKLPVVIHNREADADCLAMLQRYMDQLPGCIMHCFGSDAQVARQCVEMGCYVSFAGNVTYPKAESLRAAALAVPLDRILVETDAPYLAPQVKRGKRCEPAFVHFTGEFLASLKGVSVATFAEATTANAMRVYQISPA